MGMENGVPGPDLRVSPEHLLRLAGAYERAAARMRPALDQIRRSARIEAWTQDKVSVEMAAHYNEQVFGPDGTGQSPYCTYGAMRLYEQQLIAARDTILRIHADYVRAEADAAAPFTAP
jgi:hypothetical protein